METPRPMFASGSIPRKRRTRRVLSALTGTNATVWPNSLHSEIAGRLRAHCGPLGVQTDPFGAPVNPAHLEKAPQFEINLSLRKFEAIRARGEGGATRDGSLR